MMASNLSAAESAGQQPGQETKVDSWWLEEWSSRLACLGACVVAICGGLTCVFNFITLSISGVLGGGLQMAAGAVILAIEGSSFVSFLKPIGEFCANKPVWFKTAVYVGLTLIPIIIGTIGFWSLLGFLVSAAITAMYGMLLVGRKGDLGGAMAQQNAVLIM